MLDHRHNPPRVNQCDNFSGCKSGGKGTARFFPITYFSFSLARLEPFFKDMHSSPTTPAPYSTFPGTEGLSTFNAGLSAASPNAFDGRNILLTGATGLIGGELLKAIIERYNPNAIYTLVRGRHNATPESRVVTRLAHCTKSIPESLQVIEGELTTANCGLNPQVYKTICDTTEVILHCAADTSFLDGAGVLEANIESVRNILEMAKQCAKMPLFVYVSTAANVGQVQSRTICESDDAETEHHNEYTQSKGMAEALVRASGLPYLILRPSIVLSAGITDQTFAKSILWCAPLFTLFNALPMNADSRIDVIPVSYVTDSIIELLNQPSLEHDCYYISAGAHNCTLAGEVVRLVKEFYAIDCPKALVHPDKWTGADYKQYVKNSDQRKAFFALRYYFPFINMDVAYSNERLKQQLKDRMPALPPLSSYLAPLLQQIPVSLSLAEAARP